MPEPSPADAPPPDAAQPDAGQSDAGQIDAGLIEGLSAVTLAVADMAASVHFYRVLGFTVAVGGPEAAFTTLRAGPAFLNLQLDPDHAPVPRPWGRPIFWTRDVDEVHRRAVHAGLRPDAPPADAPWGERYFHIHDPDGHEISIARPLGGAAAPDA